jgi:isoleucyl-tRNA synthetase
VVEGLGVRVDPARGGKCERCWIVRPLGGPEAAHPTLCSRCTEVIS